MKLCALLVLAAFAGAQGMTAHDYMVSIQGFMQLVSPGGKIPEPQTPWELSVMKANLSELNKGLEAELQHMKWNRGQATTNFQMTTPDKNTLKAETNVNAKNGNFSGDLVVTGNFKDKPINEKRKYTLTYSTLKVKIINEATAKTDDFMRGPKDVKMSAKHEIQDAEGEIEGGEIEGITMEQLQKEISQHFLAQLDDLFTKTSLKGSPVNS